MLPQRLDRWMEWLLPGLGFAFAVLILIGLALHVARSWRRRRQRVLLEDALKQICSAKIDGRSVALAELGGRLGISAASALRLAQDLESSGLLRSHAGALELTEKGEHLGMRVLRGHRLWERYLSDEAQLPLDELHDRAERAEHRLAAEDLDVLADHLGHPKTDPHGDLIPTAAAEIPLQRRMPLTDWPPGRFAVVVHVEDEPRQALQEALGAGLRPGTVLRVTRREAEEIVCETSAGLSTVKPAVAAQIDVRAATDQERLAKPGITLSQLSLGEEAEVLGLSERCTGLRRRRLLDLGFTAGATIRAVLSNVGDEAHAYRIRDTLIALREEEAEQVLIRRLEATHRNSHQAAEGLS